MRISDWSSDVCSSDLVIVADLAKKNAVARLAAELEARELTIDILVNNAGFGARGDFAALDRAVQARMIDLNCRALIDLTHAVLPGMIAARRGAILNVASTAALPPGPWMAGYYATKAFVRSEENPSDTQPLMGHSEAVFFLK